MKLSQVSLNTFQPNFKCQIVADENFEKFAKKMIKNDSDFNDFLFAQQSLLGVHEDTFIKIKEIENEGEMEIEVLNPKRGQAEKAAVGINKNDFVFRKDTNPALFGLLKLADPSSEEHRYILGKPQNEDDAQRHMWSAELDMYNVLDTNPFGVKLQQVSNRLEDCKMDTECVDMLSDLHSEKQEFAMALLKSRCVPNNL